MDVLMYISFHPHRVKMEKSVAVPESLQPFGVSKLYDHMTVQEQQAITDGELVDRILDGETGLYELIMRRYNQRLFRMIRSVLRDDREAEDTLQESWVRIYEHLK